MAEYYVIDERTNQIVNVVMTQKPVEEVRALYREGFTVTTEPTETQLEGYQYYRERP